MNGVVNLDDLGEVMEKVVVNGDLSPLTPAQRTIYYQKMCQSLGLNPLTKPFAYIKLNGKMVLYALRDAADQLRHKHSISIEIVSQKIEKGILVVHVRAKDKDGRTDEDMGAVPYPANVQGEAAANLMMKAITKAKRRVTLSISGLGMLDETEVGSVPGAELVGPDGEPIDAPIKRKTSAAAKRDGTEQEFKKLQAELEKVDGGTSLGHFLKKNDKALKALPREWYINLAEDISVKAEEYEVEFHVVEQTSLRMS